MHCGRTVITGPFGITPMQQTALYKHNERCKHAEQEKMKRKWSNDEAQIMINRVIFLHMFNTLTQQHE